MTYIISAIIGYLFGSIQTSYLLGKILFKKDIKQMGNGNAGASNATMVFGFKFGAITAVIDALKAVIAIVIVKILFKNSLNDTELINLVYLCGIMAIIGHNFPFYMKFRGGKGTATLFGVLFAINIWLGLVAVGIFLLAVVITDYIVIGTVALYVVFLVYTIMYSMTPIALIIALIVLFMGTFKHRRNLVDIKNKNEKKVSVVLGINSKSK